MLPNDMRFAVVDIETTGLFPGMHDRIIEIGVVNLDSKGRKVREYATLINPQRDVGPTHIHGISAADVVSAPRFEDIAGDIADSLSESILVAHNARFDLDFLEAEFGRVGVALPPLPSVCTLTLAYRANLSATSRRLADCCAACGIRHSSSHMALDDARAVAQLLFVLLQSLRLTTIEQLGCAVHCLPPACVPELSRTNVSCTREVALAVQQDARGYLARLASKMPLTATEDLFQDAESEGVVSYLDLLDRVLEDRYITPLEAQALIQRAAHRGMSRSKLDQLHRRYLSQLVTAALADGHITELEHRDLVNVAGWLGLDEVALESQISQASRLPAQVPGGGSGPSAQSLEGKTVCFTGQFSAKIGGQPVTREVAEELACSAGMIVASGVSNRLDLLVAADPSSQSGKAAKARAHGVRIVPEDVFWRMIDAPVD